MNTEVENKPLFSTTKKLGENVKQYVALLRTLIVTCKSKDVDEDVIRDQLINGINNLRIQEKLLSIKEHMVGNVITLAN